LRGFTLIELVIVACILAILAGIAIPRLATSLAWRRVESAALRVCNDLRLAARYAKQRSASQTVSFDATANSYQLVGRPDLDHPGSEYTVLLGQPPYEVAIVSADFGGDGSVVFDGFGVPDSGGSVIIKAGKHRVIVTLDAATGQTGVETSVVPG